MVDIHAEVDRLYRLVIDAERERGAAPDTLPSRNCHRAQPDERAAMLFAAFVGEQPSVPQAHVLDTLVHIWVNSIYGEAH